MSRAGRVLLSFLAIAITSSCARSVRVTLPSGPGTPFPDFAAAYSQATSACRDIKTMSASLALSGRTGSTKLAARIDAGFAEPSRLRLEGYPRVNFGGKPFFILVADGETSTLLLVRDDRVLRGAAPSAIVEALAGVALDPRELRAVVSGCAFASATPSAGRVFANGWAAIDSGDTTVFLRQDESAWRLVAARRRSLTIEYSNFSNGRPGTVRMIASGESGSAPADLTVRTSQVEINMPLTEAVFQIQVPGTAAPITIDELRRALRSQ
jgi:hypothetical protein